MACIPVVDPTCNPIQDVITDGVTAIFDKVAEVMVETAGWAVKTLVTGWIMAPSPIMDNTDVVDNLRRYTYWIMTAIAVCALLVAATRMVLTGNGQDGVNAAAGMGKLVLVTSLTVPVVIALTEFGDGYSRWIINQSVGDGLDERVALFAPTAAIPGLTQFAIIAIALLCVIVSIVQMFISIAVGGLKILLAGLAPLPAAASMTDGGNATLARYLSWLGAALLYKPVAATIYAGAFWMVGTGQSLETVLTGIVVIASAIVALPALLRLLAPITALVGAGGGGAGAAAASGAGVVASGAVRLSGARGSSGGGGPQPSAPTGTTGTAGADARRPAAIGPGPGGSGAGESGPAGGPGGADPAGQRGPAGASPGAGSGAPGSTGGPAGGAAGAAGGGGAPAAAGGGASVGSGAAAGGGAAAGAGAAGGAAAAAGPAGAAIAVGTAAAKAGPAVVRKVGGTASGAAEEGEQQ
ncbi:hypothetical protein [Couchioplanes caeruleus]|uniref:TrbL/VirB6 plasmid conjugal transfer protein n=3 Tax=Couchioplanes caeruleus TaxID=56438 RepID=A0A1K0FNZ2_9ACTN|nr:hypothetical protein [Couchioplanes caeruleus]OJF14559.1 hypothetical protein BG844_09125 [Couchioplanes caeruleus subsp. caeruleus]ROP21245.1 hypothetical protein EDD30_7641 [Couchioplanes caeruleus]